MLSEEQRARVKRAYEMDFPFAHAIVYAALYKGWDWLQDMGEKDLNFIRGTETATIVYPGLKMFRNGEELEGYILHRTGEYFQ